MEQLNSYKPSRRDVLRDALLAALFAACLITILEYIGFNEEVNAEALRLAVSLVGHPQDSADTDPPAAAVMPAVVLFSQAWYESYFNQTSPLERGKLMDAMNALLDASAVPGQLVIDIDLSPLPQGGDPQQAALDRLLAKLAAELPQGVTLTTPAPVVTPQAYEIKRAWLENMCRAGVRFGLPHLHAHEGVVLKRLLAPQTLANVAYAAAQQRENSAVVCRRVEQSGDELDFLWLTPASPSGEFEPINAHFYRHLSPFVVDSLQELKRAWRPRSDQTVFIGGSYGYGDWYLTPAGRQPGVVLHAAAYYSAHDSVAPVSMAWSLSIGVACALVGGYLLVVLKRVVEPYWMIAVVAPLVLPIMLLVALSLLLAIFLAWNIVFSVAMVTEAAVLFAEFFPSLRSAQRSAQGKCCVFFDSYVSLVVFLLVVLLTAVLVFVHEVL